MKSYQNEILTEVIREATGKHFCRRHVDHARNITRLKMAEQISERMALSEGARSFDLARRYKNILKRWRWLALLVLVVVLWLLSGLMFRVEAQKGQAIEIDLCRLECVEDLPENMDINEEGDLVIRDVFETYRWEAGDFGAAWYRREREVRTITIKNNCREKKILNAHKGD